MCCHGYAVTFIMMSWIIQIGLFSLLSLRRLIYAWVPRGRLQSFLCLNLRLPVPGNKPAMIINQRIFFSKPNLKSKPYQVSCSPVVFSALALIFSCVCFLITARPVAPEMYLLSFILFSVLASSKALMHSTPLTAIEGLFCQNLFVNTFFSSSCLLSPQILPLCGYKLKICLCKFFREPDPPWLPHHRYGSPAEGG